MTAIRWMRFNCPKCQTNSIVLRRFGFDHEGTLALEGWCKDCGYNLTITHTFDEQRGDVREAFNWWCEQAGEESEPRDWRLWEWEVIDNEDTD